MWGCDCRHRVGDTLSYYPHTRSVVCAHHTARLSTLRVGDTLLLISQEVSLINTDPILCQESSMLLGKSLLVMVFLLLHDIAYDHILVAQAVAESSILSSPATKARKMRVRFQPLATIRLNTLHE